MSNCMVSTDTVVFTVGHSNHAAGAFLMLLRQNDITEVLDVRSAPYSRYARHFNKSPLEDLLRSEGIGYKYMGHSLGGPGRDHPGADERVDLESIRQTERYRQGLERVTLLAQNRRVALMCSENDPMRCHRFVLLSRDLESLGLRVLHILRGGSTTSQSELEQDMVREYFGEFVQASLFSDTEPESLLQRAYRLRAEDMGLSGEEGES